MTLSIFHVIIHFMSQSKFQDLTEKLCTNCGLVLPLGAFYQKSLNSPEGRRYKSAYARAMAPCKKCRIAYSKQRKANPERKREIRDWNLRRNYGITLEKYEVMLSSQNDVCAICEQPPSGVSSRTKYLHVDHCHKTGRIRGLLCHMCNRGLGSLRDSPALLRKGAAYLEG